MKEFFPSVILLSRAVLHAPLTPPFTHLPAKSTKWIFETVSLGMSFMKTACTNVIVKMA